MENIRHRWDFPRQVIGVFISTCLPSEEHNLDQGGLPPEFCLQFNCDLIFLDITPLALNIGIVYLIVDFLNQQPTL